MKIGFIGLGVMGSRMAANLQKNGHSLVVFNRTRAKAEPLLGPCGTFSDSPAKLAEEVDILFTMLARPDVVEEAALGTNGFLNHLRPDALWVDCSSVNPSFSKKMAAEAGRREVHFVDAPVTGSAVPAAEATLVFWVGADPVDLERIRSLLLCMGNKIVHTGGHGTGTSMKMVVNLFGQCHGGIRRRNGIGRRARAIVKDVVRFIAWHAFGRTVSRVEAGENRAWELRSRISVALDAKGHASRISEWVRIWGGHPRGQCCEGTVSPRDEGRPRHPGFLSRLRLPHDDPQIAGSGEGITSLSNRNIGETAAQATPAFSPKTF